MGKKELAQWVIDNRYPKPEQEKVSDAEMYQFIVDNITQTEWISVEDRLPETSDNVFAVLDGETCIMSYFNFNHDGEVIKVWGYVYDGIKGEGIYDDDYEPTHWMPLPSSPKHNTLKGE